MNSRCIYRIVSVQQIRPISCTNGFWHHPLCRSLLIQRYSQLQKALTGCPGIIGQNRIVGHAGDCWEICQPQSCSPTNVTWFLDVVKHLLHTCNYILAHGSEAIMFACWCTLWKSGCFGGRACSPLQCATMKTEVGKMTLNSEPESASILTYTVNRNDKPQDLRCNML